LTPGNPTESSIKLNWTAPDSDYGPASYDIRYSSSNITPANWDSAIPCIGEPIPSATGNAEIFITGGLSSATTYYFALQTSDNASNRSELSNIASATTLSQPDEPPSGGGGGGGGSSDTTSLSEYITGTGRLVVEARAQSSDQLVKIIIPKDTIGKDRNGGRLRFITIKKQSAPPDAPADCQRVCNAYDIGPSGATLEPFGNLVFYYTDAQVPEGVAEENLVLATLQDGTWVVLEGCVVDPVKNTITAPISHFSIYTAMAPTAPAQFEVADMTVAPAEVETGDPVTVSVTVTNTGDLTGDYTVVLKLNNVEEQYETVTLKGDESQDVSFTVAPDKAGKYTLDVMGETGQLTVKEAEGVPAEPEPTPTPEPTQPPAAEPAATPAQPVEPETAPEPAATEQTQEKTIPPSERITWWLVLIYVVCGVIVAGLWIFLFVRRRRI
jgi:hypothetical protein